MKQHLFIQPQDILILRANKAFGDAGSFGETQILPWPSVVSGALRSHLFAQGKSAEWLQQAENFTLTGLSLARKNAQGSIERLHALPADVVVHQDSTSKVITIQTLKPQKLHSKLQSSAPLEKLPVLAEKTRSKPVSGYYFNQTGWLAYLKGEKLDAEKHLVKTETLWKLDNRIGIGLNADTRSVEDGKLFTTQAVAFKENIGFYTALNCPEKLERGLLRLGGDGRAAGFGPISPLDETVNVHDLVRAKAFKLVLTTPALLENGWQPSLPFATLVSAAVSRAEVISGWDLAKRQPKAAQRVAPTGSVYWFEGFTGTANDLQNLLDNGLPCPDLTRQIEGFNRCSLAHWSSKNAGL